MTSKPIQSDDIWAEATAWAATPAVWRASHLNIDPETADRVGLSWAIQANAQDVEEQAYKMGMLAGENPAYRRRQSGPSIQAGESRESYGGRRIHEEIQTVAQTEGIRLATGELIRFKPGEAEMSRTGQAGPYKVAATLDLYSQEHNVSVEIKPGTRAESIQKYGHQLAAQLLAMPEGGRLYLLNYGKQADFKNGDQVDAGRVRQMLAAAQAQPITLEELAAAGVNVPKRIEKLEAWRKTVAPAIAQYTPNRPYEILKGLSINEQTDEVMNAFKVAQGAAVANVAIQRAYGGETPTWGGIPQRGAEMSLNDLHLAGVSVGLTRQETLDFAQRVSGKSVEALRMDPLNISKTIQALKAEYIPGYEAYRQHEIGMPGGSGEQGVMSAMRYRELTEYGRQALALGVSWDDPSLKATRDQYGNLPVDLGIYGKTASARAETLAVLDYSFWPKEGDATLLSAKEEKVFKRRALIGKHPLWNVAGLAAQRGFAAGPSSRTGEEFQVLNTLFLTPTAAGGANITPSGTALIAPELSTITNRTTKDVTWNAEKGEEPVQMPAKLVEALASGQGLRVKKGERYSLGEGLTPEVAQYDMRILEAAAFNERGKTGRRYLMERENSILGFGKIAYGAIKSMLMPSEDLRTLQLRTARGQADSMSIQLAAEMKDPVGMAYQINQAELSIARSGDKAQLRELAKFLGQDPKGLKESTIRNRVQAQLAGELGYKSWSELPNSIAEMGAKPLERIQNQFDRYAVTGMIEQTIHKSNLGYYQPSMIGAGQAIPGQSDYVRITQQVAGLRGMAAQRVMPEYDPGTPNLNVQTQRDIGIYPANQGMLDRLIATGSGRMRATQNALLARGMTEGSEPLNALNADAMTGLFSHALTTAEAWTRNPLQALGMSEREERRLRYHGVNTYEDLIGQSNSVLAKYGRSNITASGAWREAAEQAIAARQKGEPMELDTQQVNKNLLDVLSRLGVQNVGDQTLAPATRLWSFQSGENRVVMPDVQETLNYFRTSGKYQGQEGSAIGNALGQLVRAWSVDDTDEVKNAAIERARDALMGPKGLTSGVEVTKRATSLQSSDVAGRKILPGDVLSTGQQNARGEWSGAVEAYFPKRELQGQVGYVFGSPNQAGSFDPRMAVKFLTAEELKQRPGNLDPNRAYMPTTLAEALGRDFDGDIAYAVVNGALGVNEQGQIYNKQTGELYNSSGAIHAEAQRIRNEGGPNAAKEFRGQDADPLGGIRAAITDKLKAYEKPQLTEALSKGAGAYNMMGRLYNPTSKMRAMAYDRLKEARESGSLEELAKARQSYMAAARFHGQVYNVVQRPERLGPVMRQMTTILTGMNLSGTTGEASGEGAMRMTSVRGWAGVRQAAVHAFSEGLYAKQDQPDYISPAIASQLWATASQSVEQLLDIFSKAQGLGSVTKAEAFLSNVLPSWKNFHESIFGGAAMGSALVKWQNRVRREAGTDDEAVLQRRLQFEAGIQGLTPERAAIYERLAAQGKTAIAATGPVGLNDWAQTPAEGMNRARQTGDIPGPVQEAALRGHIISVFGPLQQRAQEAQAQTVPQAGAAPGDVSGASVAVSGAMPAEQVARYQAARAAGEFTGSLHDFRDQENQAAAAGGSGQPPNPPPVAQANAEAEPPRRRPVGILGIQRRAQNRGPEGELGIIGRVVGMFPQGERMAALDKVLAMHGSGGGGGVGGTPWGKGKPSKTWLQADFDEIKGHFEIVKQWVLQNGGTATTTPEGLASVSGGQFDDAAPVTPEGRTAHTQFASSVQALNRAMMQNPGEFAEDPIRTEILNQLFGWNVQRSAIRTQLGLDKVGRQRGFQNLEQQLSGGWSSLVEQFGADPIGMRRQIRADYGQRLGGQMNTALTGMQPMATEAQINAAAGAIGTMQSQGALKAGSADDAVRELRNLADAAKKNVKAFDDLYHAMRPEDRARIDQYQALVRAPKPEYWKVETQIAAKTLAGIEGPDQDRAKMIQQMAGLSGTKTGLREAGGNIMDELTFGWTAFRMRMAWNLATSNQRKWMDTGEDQERGLTAAAFQMGSAPGQTTGMTFLGGRAAMQNAQANWGRGAAQVMTPFYQMMGQFQGGETFGAAATGIGYAAGTGITTAYGLSLLGKVLAAAGAGIGPVLAGAAAPVGIAIGVGVGAGLFGAWVAGQGSEWYKQPEGSFGEAWRKAVRQGGGTLAQTSRRMGSWLSQAAIDLGLGGAPISVPEDTTALDMAKEKANWQPGNLAFDLEDIRKTMQSRYGKQLPADQAALAYAQLIQTTGKGWTMGKDNAQIRSVFESQIAPYVQAGLKADAIFQDRYESLSASSLPYEQFTPRAAEWAVVPRVQQPLLQQTEKVLANAAQIRGSAFSMDELAAETKRFNRLKSAAKISTFNETAEKLALQTGRSADSIRGKAGIAGYDWLAPDLMQQAMQMSEGMGGLAGYGGFMPSTSQAAQFETSLLGSPPNLTAGRTTSLSMAGGMLQQSFGQFGQSPGAGIINSWSNLLQSNKVNPMAMQQFNSMMGSQVGFAFRKMNDAGNVMNAFGGQGWQYGGMEYSPTMGLQEIGAAQMYQANISLQRAQYGNQIAGIQASMRMANLQGAYIQATRPLEDASIAAGRQYSLLQLDFGRRRAAQSYQQSLESIGLSERLFYAGTAQQREEFGISQFQLGKQREWQREDFAYQQSMSGMQYGWGQEDLERNMRLASGRERQQMRRQYERNQITYSMQQGQAGRERERAETRGDWQEQNIARQKKNFEELNKLQEEQFSMQRKHLTQNFALQMEQYAAQEAHMHQMWGIEDEQRKLQRNYQDEQLKNEQEQLKRQLALAQQALANFNQEQQWAAARQKAAKEYNDEVYFAIMEGGKLRATFQTMVDEWERELNRLKELAKSGAGASATSAPPTGPVRYPDYVPPLPSIKSSGNQNLATTQALNQIAQRKQGQSPVYVMVKIGDHELKDIMVDVSQSALFEQALAAQRRNATNRGVYGYQ